MGSLGGDTAVWQNRAGLQALFVLPVTKGSAQLRWRQLHWGLQSTSKCSSTFTWEALMARKNCSCSGGLQNLKGSLI